MATTAIHSLEKPTAGTKPWTTAINGNWDTIDAMFSPTNTVTTAGLANDSVTGLKILLANNVGLNQDDSGGTERTILNLTSSDILSLYDAGGNELLEGAATASAVNHIELTNSATGNNPMLSSAGSDSNVGLILGDSNDNEVLILESVASALNELTLTNSATGNPVLLEASGETNVSLDIKSKGTGELGLFTNSNEALNIDTDGIITTPLQPAVLAYVSGTVSNVSGDGTTYTVVFNGEISDRNSDFNSTTGLFTAPKTGLYRVSFMARMVGITSGETDLAVQFVASNRTIQWNQALYTNSDSAGAYSPSVTSIVDMDAADTLSVTITASGGTKVVDLQGNASDCRTSISIEFLG